MPILVIGMIYLLQFCPGKTSTCFGCGNPLKPGSAIPDAPNDLVVVSEMYREWSSKGERTAKFPTFTSIAPQQIFFRRQSDTSLIVGRIIY
jgi:hypothetical protein